ncbi:hypothetical protein ACWT_4491 [Actinoplanes sp. SE50]|uniref:hypothetical protein n=1 Tax=unclassified Actinoplanes TaxID=2626549 RepID=UPI00023ECEDC|nr:MULTISPECIES: hypothetical protein [unclassified Actinoplanes]AEV85513.1 hypothetical protein ACPL_4622 [Actinoplanes sp. SE50/110]ATO83906.1 hypothetical protein ACWT_4491 [Actinoplanes sp. SE50]SLM01316.1 hypothetical protein ACSP50_4552 [Actinoplanes sp. SE50/110]
MQTPAMVGAARERARAAGFTMSSEDGCGRLLAGAVRRGGRWIDLDNTVAASTPGGVLLVDDLQPEQWGSADHERFTGEVAAALRGHPGLTAVEISWSSGVILCSRRGA